MTSENGEIEHSQCCIVGGGPAGMMLGLLLARAGVQVTILEKHGDFLRDFRGDTVHPSTLEILDEIGLLAGFEALPHQRVEQARVQLDEGEYIVADFARLKPFPYLAFVPQWDFLDLLADEGRRFPAFDLRMNTEVTDVIRESGRVVGVTAQGPEGRLSVRAPLVVATDGRHSAMRTAAGLEPERFGAPMDVLWFRLSKRDADPDRVFGRLSADAFMVMLDRDEYWQIAYLVPKGSAADRRQESISTLHASVTRLCPFLADRVDELPNWDAVKLLEVQVDRLERWYQPGLLIIGDAAHAMSPVGGVGINLAIQDAVAAANCLADPLRRRELIEEDLLAQVQRQRALPTRVIQRMQVIIQRRIIAPRLVGSRQPTRMPMVARWLLSLPAVRSTVARMIGLGIFREHVRASILSSGP